MKSYKLAALILLTAVSAATAQVSQTAVQFLLIAPGARAGGMGETFVAVSDDATAVHWNPAGLGRYPLSGAWMYYGSGSRDTVSALALVKNALPEVNYRQYDIWALVNGRLARWDGSRWAFGTMRMLKEGGSLQTLIERYTGLSESDAEGYVDKIARANNEIMPEEIDSLKAIIVPVIPDDYDYGEEIEYGFEKLHTAWLRLRIDADGFHKLEAEIREASEQSPVQSGTLDKIAFGFDKAIAPKPNSGVMIPYNLILPDSLTCLQSDDKLIYVGSAEGLFRLDPAKLLWSSYSMATDSLPSNNITAVQKVGTKAMFIGTDKGIVRFTGARFENFGARAGAPEGYISAIGANGERDVWAASDNDLYHYNGTVWSNAKDEELSIGESLIATVRAFYGSFGQAWQNKLMGKIAEYNARQLDTVQAGESVKLPYRLGFRGDITRLSVDSKGDLWIGTTRGIVLFTDQGFRQYGYKMHEVPEDGTTAETIAAQYIPGRDQARIDKLAALIRDYNDLESDDLKSGDKVLVYANALGSEIVSIEPISSNRALVGTSFGVVEYSKGKWSRLQNIEMSRREVIDVEERNNELWVAVPEKVAVYSSARKNITFMHSNYLVELASDLYYDYFSFVYPTAEWGTFGFGVTFLSYGKQERTNEYNVSEGTFYSYDLAFTLSYGTKLMENVSGGLSLRYINSHLAVLGAGREKGKGTGYSLAVDGGILYDLSRRLTLGATVTNLGPDIAYIDADQADPLPRKLAVGFNYKIVDSPFNRLSVLGEADKILVGLGDDFSTEIKEIIPHVGLEYWYSNYVSLRSGYVYDYVGVQRYFTLGASLQYTNYRFDFSYIPSSNEAFNRLGNTMRFSMNVGF